MKEVLRNKKGQFIKGSKGPKTVFKKGFTNNEAELLGVYNALKVAQKDDTVSTDSQIVIKWVLRGNRLPKKRKRKDLDSIKLECNKLMNSKKIKLIWEERSKNLAGIHNEYCELDNSIPEPDLSWII